MPEYFDILFIEQKKCKKDRDIGKLFCEKYKLIYGKNSLQESEFKILTRKRILFNRLDRGPSDDYVEHYLSLPSIRFHKKKILGELKQFTDLIEDCFKESPCLEFALCGFEIGIGDVPKLKDFDKKFLSKFPIVYKKREGQAPELMLHLGAQDIFTLYPIQITPKEEKTSTKV